MAGGGGGGADVTTGNDGIIRRTNPPPSNNNIVDANRINLVDRPRDGASPYCLSVILNIKPDRRDEFLRCINANQLGTLKTEPNAITYVYGEDESTPNSFRFFEQYVDRNGFEEHAASDHFAKWEIFANTEPFACEPIIKFFVEDEVNGGGVCMGSRGVRDAILAAGHFDDDGEVENGEKGSVKLFCLDVTMQVRPEMRDMFLDELRLDQRGAMDTEPNAVSYLFGEDVNIPNLFHMFEAYTGGRSGFEEHMRTPHYTRWTKFKEEYAPFVEPIEVGYYEIRLPHGGPSR
jgi:quinol monooxygenase YgiN